MMERRKKRKMFFSSKVIGKRNKKNYFTPCFSFSDAEEIALLEPLGVAHNGAEKLKAKDEDVLVIGCGPMGLLVQMLAKVMGAKR